MRTQILRLTLGGALIIALAGWVVTTCKLHTRLERIAAELRRRYEQTVLEQQSDKEAQAILARARAGDAAAARTVQAELLLDRAEADALARQAADRRAQKLAHDVSAEEGLDRSRDPESGMTRLEYFRNVGRGTPAAAFQTLIWAAVKGDESLPGMFAITSAAEDKAQALIATLPPEVQAKYATPEELAALAISDLVLRQPAAQILAATQTDPLDTTLTVQGSADPGPTRIPMQLTANGWQMALTPKEIDAIQRLLLNPAPR